MDTKKTLNLFTKIQQNIEAKPLIPWGIDLLLSLSIIEFDNVVT